MWGWVSSVIGSMLKIKGMYATGKNAEEKLKR